MIRRPPRSTLFPLHDALPILSDRDLASKIGKSTLASRTSMLTMVASSSDPVRDAAAVAAHDQQRQGPAEDRKSTRLNSSHANISYAVFCLKKKKKKRPLEPIY